jgi:hypothetical protein
VKVLQGVEVMATAKMKTTYDVSPGVAMMQKWIDELKSKTGRSVEEWITLVKQEGPKDEKSQREWLKSKHKLGANSAGWIAERQRRRGRLAGSVSENRSEVCGRSIWGAEGETSPRF